MTLMRASTYGPQLSSSTEFFGKMSALQTSPKPRILRAKLKAAGLHFFVTLTVSALAAGLVFGAWFPSPFAAMLGGLQLFILVVICDLILGPVISLVIYHPDKPRSELTRDYALVCAIQLAALIYGLYAVAVTRPAFVVFAVDRYEVVSAGSLSEEALAKAPNPTWRELPSFGPEFVRAERPRKTDERNELLFSGLSGKGIAYFPKYYKSLKGGEAEILSRAQTLSVLLSRHPEARMELTAVITRLKRAPESLRWLPVQHARGFWTALVDSESGTPVGWLDLDPY